MFRPIGHLVFIAVSVSLLFSSLPRSLPLQPLRPFVYHLLNSCPSPIKRSRPSPSSYDTGSTCLSLRMFLGWQSDVGQKPSYLSSVCRILSHFEGGRVCYRFLVSHYTLSPHMPRLAKLTRLTRHDESGDVKPETNKLIFLVNGYFGSFFFLEMVWKQYLECIERLIMLLSNHQVSPSPTPSSSSCPSLPTCESLCELALRPLMSVLRDQRSFWNLVALLW